MWRDCIDNQFVSLVGFKNSITIIVLYYMFEFLTFFQSKSEIDKEFMITLT
jgi:hypothetical protein